MGIPTGGAGNITRRFSQDYGSQFAYVRDHKAVSIFWAYWLSAGPGPSGIPDPNIFRWPIRGRQDPSHLINFADTFPLYWTELPSINFLPSWPVTCGVEAEFFKKVIICTILSGLLYLTFFGHFSKGIFPTASINSSARILSRGRRARATTNRWENHRPVCGQRWLGRLASRAISYLWFASRDRSDSHDIWWSAEPLKRRKGTPLHIRMET